MQVYVIATHELHQHQTVLDLQDKFSAHIYEDSPHGEWLLAVLAPTFVGSFGTYTWMAAFLSQGHSIHLPYVSTLHDGSDWCPWHHLFIHDDPRIIYHDVVNASRPTAETAEMTMSRQTVFADAVRERKDPCPGL